MREKETKVCEVCGLPFANRKRWKQRGQWESVRFCSARCRKAAGEQNRVQPKN